MTVDVSRARVNPFPEHTAALRKVPLTTFYSRINRLKRVNPERLTEQQAFDRLSRALHGYVMRSVIIGTNGVFRARVGAPNALFRNVSELWYPPSSMVIRRGRFNGKGEAKFYCSSELHAAVMEVRPKVGDRVAVVIAGARQRSAQIDLAHIGLHRAVVHSDVVGAMGSGLRGDPDFVRRLGEWGIQKRWLVLDDYLTQLATTLYAPEVEEEAYKMTLSAGRYLLRPQNHQGILYPSVASDFSAFNICLEPSAADHICTPSEVWVAEVTERLCGVPEDLERSMRFLHRSTSISGAGDIAWSDRLSEVSAHEVLGGIRRSGQPS